MTSPQKPGPSPPISVETLGFAYRLTRRFLFALCLTILAPLGCLVLLNYAPVAPLFHYRPAPELVPAMDLGAILFGVLVIGFVLYATRYAWQVGYLLGARYVSIEMAPYYIAMPALRAGYRGGLFTRLRKIHPR